MLSIEETDAALARLGAEHDAISEKLLELEDHFGRKLLEGATLEGTSLQRWSAASRAIVSLWARFDAYRQVLAQAREVRARRWWPGIPELAELTRLLTGPAVSLPAPEGSGGLTGPPWISLDELVADMRASYTGVIEVVDAADQVWSELGSRIDQCRETLGAAEALAADLGLVRGADPVADALAQSASDLDALRDRCRTDPLSLWVDGRVEDPGLEQLTDDVRQARADLDVLAQLRDEAEARLGHVTAVLVEVAGMAEQAARAQAEALAKIAATRPVSAPAASFDPQMSEAEQLRQQGHWRRLSTLLKELEQDAAVELERLRAALAVARRSLEERAELRGRLGAYRAKAARLGHAEDAALDKLYQEAQRLLWTAPCDLPAAATAVLHYQQSLPTTGAQRDHER